MKLLGLNISRNLPAPAAPTVLKGYVAESSNGGAMPNDYLDTGNFMPSGGTYSLADIRHFNAVIRGERMVTTNGIYARVLEIGRDHICGSGVEVAIETEDDNLKAIVPCLEKICAETLSNNQIETKVSQWVFECLQAGELAIPPIINPADGSVEFGDIPSLWIQDVAQNPRNASDVYGIKVQQADLFREETDEKPRIKLSGDSSFMKVMRKDNSPYILDQEGKNVLSPTNNLPLPNPDFGKLSGEVFFLRIGNLRGSKRGVGEATSVQDLCTELEQFIFTFRRAYEIQSAIVWEEIYDNLEQKELDEKARRVIPTGPLPYVHNKGVEFKMHSPSLHVSDMTETIATMIRLIAGIMGIPEFMMGDGTGTNVATAEQQTPALYQKFNVKRMIFQNFFSGMFDFVITQASKRGQVYTEDGSTYQLTAADRKKLKVAFTFKPYERNNTKDIALGIKALVDAILAMLAVNGLIDVGTARDILYTQLAALGIVIDKSQVEKELADQAQLSGVSATGNEVSMQDMA